MQVLRTTYKAIKKNYDTSIATPKYRAAFVIKKKNTSFVSRLYTYSYHKMILRITSKTQNIQRKITLPHLPFSQLHLTYLYTIQHCPMMNHIFRFNVLSITNYGKNLFLYRNKTFYFNPPRNGSHLSTPKRIMNYLRIYILTGLSHLQELDISHGVCSY